MADKRFMYLRDKYGAMPLLDLETQEVVPAGPTTKRIIGECGLRRGVLERVDVQTLKEVKGEFIPLTPEIAQKLRVNHALENSWIYDWCHYPTEAEGELPGKREAVIAGLMDMMAEFPFKFEVIGAQRRYLMYFSDGDYNSQRRFLRLVPRPQEYPFDNDGNLLEKYATGPTMPAVMQWQAKQSGEKSVLEYDGPPFDPTIVNKKELAPLLYCNPAWPIRFLLDDQQPAFGQCTVYVTDPQPRPDGKGLAPQFICSDWCQRSGRDVKVETGGIDLQAAEYTFGTWVTGPCVKRAQDEGKFIPKSAKVRTVQLASIKEKIVKIPTFEEAYAKYEPAITRLKDKGMTVEQVLVQVKADLELAKTKYEAVQQLHDVPLTVDPGQFKAETCEFYKACRADAPNSKAPFIYMRGYSKPQADGTEPEFGRVKPQYLVVDEARVREAYNPVSAFAPKDYKPLTAAEIAEHDVFLQKVLMQKGQKLAGVGVVDIPSESF